jgi:hypothetical protein
MPRRPSIVAVATLGAVIVLAACHGSPKAGRPDTLPASTAAVQSSPPTPTPTDRATPRWTAEEETAITAASARYRAARAAAGHALQHPEGRHLASLEAAGNGGAWLRSILERLDFFKKHALYQTGTSKVLSTSPSSVDLTAEQPTVVLRICIDGSGVQMRYRSTGKPVPVASTIGADRRGVLARLVYAVNATGNKMWFLTEETTSASC